MGASARAHNRERIPLKLSVVGDVERALKMPEDSFEKKYGTRKPSADNENIVFHCQGGVRSRKAMNLAHSLGYDRLDVFSASAVIIVGKYVQLELF